MSETMSEKTHRELILETLRACSAEVASWPEWMRRAASTESVFRVPTLREPREPARVSSAVVTDPELAK